MLTIRRATTSRWTCGVWAASSQRCSPASRSSPGCRKLNSSSRFVGMGFDLVRYGVVWCGGVLSQFTFTFGKLRDLTMPLGQVAWHAHSRKLARVQ